MILINIFTIRFFRVGCFTVRALWCRFSCSLILRRFPESFSLVFMQRQDSGLCVLLAYRKVSAEKMTYGNSGSYFPYAKIGFPSSPMGLLSVEVLIFTVAEPPTLPK